MLKASDACRRFRALKSIFRTMPRQLTCSHVATGLQSVLRVIRTRSSTLGWDSFLALWLERGERYLQQQRELAN